MIKNGNNDYQEPWRRFIKQPVIMGQQQFAPVQEDQPIAPMQFPSFDQIRQGWGSSPQTGHVAGVDPAAVSQPAQGMDHGSVGLAASSGAAPAGNAGPAGKGGGMFGA